jgi:hypothetical protein
MEKAIESQYASQKYNQIPNQFQLQSKYHKIKQINLATTLGNTSVG